MCIFLFVNPNCSLQCSIVGEGGVGISLIRKYLYISILCICVSMYLYFRICNTESSWLCSIVGRSRCGKFINPQLFLPVVTEHLPAAVFLKIIQIFFQIFQSISMRFLYDISRSFKRIFYMSWNSSPCCDRTPSSCCFPQNHSNIFPNIPKSF